MARQPWEGGGWEPEEELPELPQELPQEPTARASYDARLDPRPDPTRGEVLISIAKTLLALQAEIRTLALLLQRMQ